MIPSQNDFLPTDEIRARFSAAMSNMYRHEVPQYGELMTLVAQVNAGLAPANAPAREQRLDVERHGAVRVGTARELNTLRRLFAVMGMQPVGYYDLSVAGVPVHSTAFRPVGADALARNPFRVFTSLLRPELIADAALAGAAREILSRREIFTPRALQLIERHEERGGLDAAEAAEFVTEALETFRWHGDAPVSRGTYERLHDAHRLVADVVCFRGPHINHLTPRTLDIDAVQALMPQRGIAPKDVIEGPPRRKVPILLRQTSFKALQEPVRFIDSANGEGTAQGATHTARFGEIEQRGMALTRKGRALYDTLLARARDDRQGDGASYAQRLENAFRDFPDDLDAMRRDGLGFFRYMLDGQGRVIAVPITYEDFLPVSAAGIFQSNLGSEGQKNYGANAAQDDFEAALGAPVLDEIALYEAEQAASLAAVMDRLAQTEPA